MYDYPTIKLLLVMVIVPTIMNAVVFWVQDSFLKKSKFSKRDENLKKFYIDFDDEIMENEFTMEIELWCWFIHRYIHS